MAIDGQSMTSILLAMRIRGKWWLPFAAAVSLAGCSSPNSQSVVSYQHFRFTCCANDLQQAWHTSEGISLQWIAKSAGTTSDRTGHPITLSAVLTGPYATVAVLKAVGPYTRSLAAQTLTVSDRMSGDPVSSIYLPIDLPVGWYNLAFTVKSAGDKVVSATVIQVTERDRESLRKRAAHAGQISDDTVLYRVEFHVVASLPA
jgi:hypothetical protein